MFASIGSCCEGIRSTYKVVVARSKKVWGPYKDKSGKPMLKNGYSLVIGANDHFVGNGHGSQIIRDDAGQDWLLYHGFQDRSRRTDVFCCWTKSNGIKKDGLM